MISVLIADDHAILRRGLAQIIAEAGEMKVVAEAESGPQVVRLGREHRPDVVLLDISMPDRNGLDTLKLLKKEWPKTAVLMLSMHPEESYALRTIKAGASGYLNKQSAPALLVSAIRRVASGRRYISANVAEALAGSLAEGSDRAPHALLSDREYETTHFVERLVLEDGLQRATRDGLALADQVERAHHAAEREVERGGRVLARAGVERHHLAVDVDHRRTGRAARGA